MPWFELDWRQYDPNADHSGREDSALVDRQERFGLVKIKQSVHKHEERSLSDRSTFFESISCLPLQIRLSFSYSKRL